MANGEKPMLPAKKKPSKSVVDLNPTLNKPNAIVEQTGIGQSRADFAIRLGLGDPDSILYFRKAIMDPERAVQNPMLRKYVAEVAERALKLIFNDPQMWSRAQTILRRMFPNQHAASMSEAAYNSFARRAARHGIPVEALLEVYTRGLPDGISAAHARVSSFIDGGKTDQDIREEFELSASHPHVTGVKFKAKANTHDEVVKKVKSMRTAKPNHYITVHNKDTGMVHTLRNSEEYHPHMTESEKPLLSKIRKALEEKK